jgi:Undecaprenyl-phosphate glucose phosphotransferase
LLLTVVLGHFGTELRPKTNQQEQSATLLMNVNHSYALASRSAAYTTSRRWSPAFQIIFSAAMFLADALAIVASACITGIGYHMSVYQERGDLASFTTLGLLAASIFVIPYAYGGGYNFTTQYVLKSHIRRGAQLWNVTLVVLLTLGFLAKTSEVYSRGWLIAFYLGTIPLLLGLRLCFWQAAKRGSRAGLMSAQRVFLVGTGQYINAFLRRYDPQNRPIDIVGCRFLTPVPQQTAPSRRDAILRSDLDSAVEGARSLNPDAVFLLVPWSETELIETCAEVFSTLPVEIHLSPERILEKFYQGRLSTLGQLNSLQLARVPLSAIEIVQKRLLDVCIAAITLVLLSPMLLLLALLIKLDSRGPVFFIQRRYGFNQQSFPIIKFRTMSTLEDGEVVRQATQNDPRVTRIGRWLRRWNLDELPQLFNVLAGDMSLVGPRPHALSHNLEYEQRISLYARRHNVKPGITGWAQIHGHRGETDTDEKMRRRVEHDLYYIDNWSFGLDLQILLRTVISPKAYRNAY